MKHKHTPGPWFAIHAEEGAPDLTSIKSKKCGVALTTKADGDLIAAAPELLENFEKAIKLIEHMSEKFNYCVSVTINDGNELIAKARGEV